MRGPGPGPGVGPASAESQAVRPGSAGRSGVGELLGDRRAESVEEVARRERPGFRDFGDFGGSRAFRDHTMHDSGCQQGPGADSLFVGEFGGPGGAAMHDRRRALGW